MIEPYVTEKQCRACGECKPLTCFSPAPKRGQYGVQSYCKPCRSAMVAASQRGNRKKKKATDTNPTEWLMPHFPMVQSLRCIQFRKWRGPVSREPLRFAL